MRKTMRKADFCIMHAMISKYIAYNFYPTILIVFLGEEYGILFKVW